MEQEEGTKWVAVPFAGEVTVEVPVSCTTRSEMYDAALEALSEIDPRIDWADQWQFYERLTEGNVMFVEAAWQVEDAW